MFSSTTRGLIGVAVAISLWQIASWAGLVNTILLPAPIDILLAFRDQFSEGSIFRDIAASLLRVLVGFAFAAACGVVLGVSLAWSPKLSDYLKPLIEALRPIPPIAWTPLAILWFGIGNAPGYFLVFIGAVFPVFVNTYAAVRNIDRSQVNAALCLGASPRLLIVDVLVPAALPVIFPGLRIAFGVGWTCVVAAELIAAQSGLGYMIQQNRVLMQTQYVLVGMITIGVIGFLMNSLMLHIERRLSPWK